MTASSASTNLERAQAFGRWMTRRAGMYELGMHLLPGWGPRLKKALPHIRGPRVLEVSFGTGYLMRRYARGLDVTGLDADQHRTAGEPLLDTIGRV